FLVFYFWNFSFHPLVNIILKCLMISAVYIMLIKKLQISKDINELLKKYLSIK
ncbi:MAG: sugar isomerase, partial [Lutibacter sp.]